RAAIETAVAAANQRLVAERHRDVEAAADVDAEELRRRHADDGERHTIERQRPANRVRRTAEVPLPEAVADDDDGTVRTAAPTIVVVGERAAEDRRHAQRVEVRAARPDAFDELRLAAGREVEPGRRPRQRAVDETRACAKLF